MDDVSDHSSSATAGELHQQAPTVASEGGVDVGDLGCNSAGSAGIRVTREEIAILKAFLSIEIDAIINADEPLPGE